MVCGSCGAENIDVALYCRSCFLLFLPVEVATPLQGNEHFLVLLDACEQVISENATVSDFHTFLNAFEVDLAEREQAILELDIPPHLEADFAEERQAGLAGVARCKEALVSLRALGDDLNLDGFQPALVDFYQGFCLVSEAMEINRRNRDRPMWA